MDELLFAASLLILLAGCANPTLSDFEPPAPEYVALEKAPICCASYRDIKYAKLNLTDEISAVVTNQSPVFRFEYQRAYFAAFELPSEAKMMTVKTYPVSARILIPSIQFLDASYKPLGILRPEYRAQKSAFMGSPLGETELKIPTQARYALLFEALGMPGLAWRDGDSANGSRTVRAAPTGEIKLSVSASANTLLTGTVIAIEQQGSGNGLNPGASAAVSGAIGVAAIPILAMVDSYLRETFRHTVRIKETGEVLYVVERTPYKKGACLSIRMEPMLVIPALPGSCG